MANQDEIRKLLKEGVEAARAGDRDRAKDLLLQVTDMDSSNERAWFLLASIESDPEEKRVYLENVLFVNPGNDKAQRMLDALGEPGGSSKSSGGGMSNRTRLYIGAGVLITWVIVQALLFSVGLGRRADATAEAVALAATQTQQEQTSNLAFQTSQAETQAFVGTQAAEATGEILTLTATFGATATPTFDPTALTLPPEATVQLRTDTPTPEATATPNAAAAAPPPEEFPGHVLVGWGGLDASGDGYLPIRLYRLDQGDTFSLLDDVQVENVDINPANGLTLIYTRFFRTTFSTGIERANPNGTQAQLLSDVWRPLESILDASEVQYSANGTHVVFTGVGVGTGTREVFMVDFTAPPAPNQTPLRQLTNDSAEWAFPSISPDGSTVVAVRVDVNSLNPDPDLWVIDTASLTTTQLTQDGTGFVEKESRFDPDGQSIVYVGSPGSADAPGDLIRIPLTPGGLAVPVVRTVDLDERYPVFSQDGRWLAYASDATGVYNIFLKDLDNDVEYQYTTEELDPVFPGGWYQPGAVAELPAIVPLPTPVVIQEDDEEGTN